MSIRLSGIIALAGAATASVAYAAPVPLTLTETVNFDQATLTVTDRPNTSGATTQAVPVNSLQLATFSPTQGVLLGATIGYSRPITLSETANGGGGSGTRRSTTNATYATTISFPGYTLTPANVTGSVVCGVGGTNPPGACPKTASATTPQAGSQVVAENKLGQYYGNNSSSFTVGRSATLAVTNTVTGFGQNNANSFGTATVNVGDANSENNQIYVAYSYLNFANPTFDEDGNVDLQLDFGTLDLNSGPVTLNFSIFNLGDQNSTTLDLDAIDRETFDSKFSTTLTPFSDQIEGGLSQSFSITFDPSEVGDWYENYVLNLSDADIGLGQQNYTLTIGAIGSVITTPAPGAVGLLGLGLCGLAVLRRRAL